MKQDAPIKGRSIAGKDILIRRSEEKANITASGLILYCSSLHDTQKDNDDKK
jgi:hypothetical protein